MRRLRRIPAFLLSALLLFPLPVFADVIDEEGGRPVWGDEYIASLGEEIPEAEIHLSTQANMTNYVTPYGTLMVGIDTDRIDIRESEDVINIDIDYALDINYEHLANCKIKMEIKQKGSMI